MTTVIDPVRLSGLKQASYVMHCLTGGQTEEKIAIALGGDVQLVAMWISFLKHNHWITEGNGGWSVTAKGTQWSTKNTTTLQLPTEMQQPNKTPFNATLPN